MDLRAPSYLPFKRRDAYQPSDASAYLMLQQLRCVSSQDGESDPKHDPLCSLCREVLLGEPLLDDNDNETEYRVAFYALPCGHLRCCSCALKYVDTAGVFHHICEYCDSQELNAMPDLSAILDSIGYGVPLPGFDEIKPPQPPHLIEYSPIRLPTIEEVEYTILRTTPSKLNLSALKLQTPAAKRVTLDLDSPTRQTIPAKRRKVDDQDQEDSSPITSFQWTPVAQRVHKNYSPFTLEEIPETRDSPAMVEAKKAKLRGWALGCKRKSEDAGKGESGILRYEEFVEEEEQEEEEQQQQKIRKKPRLDIQ
ncbi:MAG: hypothetical protein Q9207_000546 [Kuettlingeria erythrocarpa]